MSYPPEGCSYRVEYPFVGRTQTAEFADEFELGAWFREREAVKVIDRSDPRLSIHCVTGGGDVPIDVMHPRLVRGRMEAPPA
jgi:hypothetical protein